MTVCWQICRRGWLRQASLFALGYCRVASSPWQRPGCQGDPVPFSSKGDQELADGFSGLCCSWVGGSSSPYVWQLGSDVPWVTQHIKTWYSVETQCSLQCCSEFSGFWQDWHPGLGDLKNQNSLNIWKSSVGQNQSSFLNFVVVAAITCSSSCLPYYLLYSTTPGALTKWNHGSAVVDDSYPLFILDFVWTSRCTLHYWRSLDCSSQFCATLEHITPGGPFPVLAHRQGVINI